MYSTSLGTSGRGPGVIGVAFSDDGVTWAKESAPALVATEDWEVGQVDRPRVVATDGDLVMVYAGLDLTTRGLATSGDGLTWTKLAGPNIPDQFPERLQPGPQPDLPGPDLRRDPDDRRGRRLRRRVVRDARPGQLHLRLHDPHGDDRNPHRRIGPRTGVNVRGFHRMPLGAQPVAEGCASSGLPVAIPARPVAGRNRMRTAARTAAPMLTQNVDAIARANAS